MKSSAAAVRSVNTPFALAAAKPLGGQPDLVALFVVVTGVFGMAVGDMLFLRLSIREGMAKGAGFGVGAGTARSYELGQQEGVVASPVMMLSGVTMVLIAPLVAWVMSPGQNGRFSARGPAQRPASLRADKLGAEFFTLGLPSGELSVAEKTQIPINATAMENSAGYSYGKIALS